MHRYAAVCISSPNCDVSPFQRGNLWHTEPLVKSYLTASNYFFRFSSLNFLPFARFIHNYFWLWEAGSFGGHEYLFLAGWDCSVCTWRNQTRVLAARKLLIVPRRAWAVCGKSLSTPSEGAGCPHFDMDDVIKRERLPDGSKVVKSPPSAGSSGSKAKTGSKTPPCQPVNACWGGGLGGLGSLQL